MRRSLMSVLFASVAVGCVSPALAGWTSRVLPDDSHYAPGRASISHSTGGGLPAFRDALDELAKGGHVQRLESIGLSSLLNEAGFQSELFTALEQAAPDQLAEARRSAGNMHNPKIQALRSHFEQAILATPTVKSLNADLAPFRLQVTGASFEKFSLLRKEDRQSISCHLVLEVTAITSP